MYGLVNQAVKGLVTSNFGEEKWQAIRSKAGVDEDFDRMRAYPDEVTTKLVGAASEVLDMEPDDVLRAFGEYWVLFTGAEGYGHMFDVAGSSLKDFLLNLDHLHTRIGQNFSELVPPSFQFSMEGDKMRMHYYSERQGLCPMVEGLLTGLSKRFDTEMTVEHPRCSRTSDDIDHCEFLLKIG